MVPLSRRRLGKCLVGVSVGIGGCAEAETGARTPTATATEPSFPQGTDVPSTRQIRHSTGDPAVRSSLVDLPSEWSSVHWVVSSQREQGALEFTDETQGVPAAEEFVRETDLATETVLVHQYKVEECSTRQLNRLQWKKSTGPGGSLRD